MIHKILLFLPVFILPFFSCDEEQTVQTNKDDSSTIKELTMKWNEFLVKKDLIGLSSLYADKLTLYGSAVTKEEALSGKENFFKKYADFNQSITGDITIIKITDQQYNVTFPKRSTYNSKTLDVEGRLTFYKSGDSWKITNESDDISDATMNTDESKKNKTCLDVVIEIVTNSPLYLKKTKGLYDAVIKNGGSGFGISLESSPDPESEDAFEFSDTYDFNLYENYPDRINVIARFSFNPEDHTLYEYDYINDEYTPIPFDQKYLVNFDEICK